jgi:hypothetical protein
MRIVRSMNRWSRALVLCGLVVLPVMVSGQPALNSVGVTPATVSAGEEITLTVGLSSPQGVDLSRLRAVVVNSEGGDAHWFSSWSEAGPGVFASTVQIQPFAAEGAWSLSYVLAYDDAGRGTFFRAGREFDLSFLVTNDAPDTRPPELVAAHFDSPIAIQGGSARLTVEFADAPAGVNWANVRGYLRNPAGTLSWLSDWMATDNPDARVVEVPLPSNALTGEWVLEHILAYDDAGNAQWYRNGEDYHASFLLAPQLQFVQQPVDVVALDGAEARFTVEVIGAMPLYFQWLRNGVSLPAAAASELVLETVGSADDNALFACVVSNAFQVATSTVARLTVVPRDAPTFIEQPVDQRVLEGFDAIFAALAFGPQPITYQWQRDGLNIMGATNAVLQIDDVAPGDANAEFRVMAMNEFGVSTSEVARLEVNTHPAGWLYRAKLVFPEYDRDEPLLDFPALIRLHESESGFRYAQVASPLGADVRFRDAKGDDWLPHEVEAWNPEGNSDLWVRVPRLDSNDTFIWMYWGNEEELSPPGYTTDGSTWSADYQSVWHLDEEGRDASPQANDATNVGAEPIPGVVAGAYQFDGINHRMTTDDFQPGGSMTASLWIRMDAQTAGGSVWRTILANCAVDTSGFYLTARRENADGELILKMGTSGGFQNLEFGNIGTGVWRHVAFTYDQVEQRVRTFIDGVPAFNGTGFVNNPNAAVWLAGEPADASRRFRGGLDEIRLSAVPRSPNWIWAKWRNQAQPDQFVQMAAVSFPDTPFIDHGPGATDVTWNSARLGADLISTGAAPTRVTLFWGESDGDTSVLDWDHIGDLGFQSAGVILEEVTGLAEGTAYCYRYAASNAFGLVWSPATTRFETPSLSPDIEENPAAAHVELGDPATFSVVASGVEPLFYQWQQDGVDLPGANDATLVWPSAEREQDGASFRCLVSNAFGAVTSDAAFLTVQRVYTSRGFEASLYSPGSVVNQDGVGGSWLQWNEADGNFGQPTWAVVQTNRMFAGRQALALTNAGQRVIARRLFSPALAGEPVYVHTWILMEPPPNQVNVFRVVLRWGANNKLFPVTSAGTALYDNADPDATVLFAPGEWNRVVIRVDPIEQHYTLFVNQFTNFISGSIPAGGLTSWELDYGSVLALDEGFGAFVDDLYVDTVNPIQALAPVILSQPGGQSVVEGGTAEFAVSFVGAEPVNVQWRQNGIPITGANQAALVRESVSLADDGRQYDVIIANQYGAVTSSVALLTVTLSPDIVFDAQGFEVPLYSEGPIVGQQATAGSWLQWNQTDGNFGQPGWTVIQTQRVFAGQQALALTNAGERVIARRLFSPSLTNEVQYVDARIWTPAHDTDVSVCRVVLRWSGGSRLFVFQTSGNYIYDNADSNLRAVFNPGDWNRVVIRVDRAAGTYTFRANQATNVFSGPLTTQAIASWEIDYGSTLTAAPGFGVVVDDLRVTIADPLISAGPSVAKAMIRMGGMTESGPQYEYLWKTTPGRTYRVERTTDLVAPVWTVLDEFVSGGEEVYWVFEGMGDYPAGFIRLREVE